MTAECSEATTSLHDPATAAWMWSIETGDRLWTTAEAAYRCGAFTLDGVTIALGRADGGVDLMASKSGQLLWRAWGGANEEVTSLAWSRDGSSLAVGLSSGVVRRLDVTSGERLSKVQAVEGPVVLLVHDRVIVASDGERIVMISAGRKRFEIACARACAMAMTLQGSLVVAGVMPEGGHWRLRIGSLQGDNATGDTTQKVHL